MNVDDLNDVECETLFHNLNLCMKRKLLRTKDVEVKFNNASVFRDVITIVARYVDLHAWGRLKSSNAVFHKTLEIYPTLQTLRTVFEPIPHNDYKLWVSNIQGLQSTCESMFFNCVKRVIIYAHAKVEKDHKKRRITPQKDPMFNSLRIVTNFDLQHELHIIEEILPKKFEQVRGGLNAWVQLPFGGVYVSYPWGYLCNPNTKNPYGNIFCEPDTWKSMLYTKERAYITHNPHCKTHDEMTKAQRVVFKIQKQQLKLLINKK